MIKHRKEFNGKKIASILVSIMMLFNVVGMNAVAAATQDFAPKNGKVENIYDKMGNFLYTLDSTYTSRHYYYGREGHTVKEIVIHHWGNEGQKFDNVRNYLCSNKDYWDDDAAVSAHYVAEAGRVAYIVPEADTAWHAGNKIVNKESIGIECRPEATDADYRTVAALVAGIWLRLGYIPLIGHRDVVATSCPGKWDLSRIEALAKTIMVVPRGTWKYENNKWYYEIDGKKKTGWVWYQNAWYYLQDDGSMALGKVIKMSSGLSYFFDYNGAMQVGWCHDEVKDIWYYAESNGALFKGDWKKVNSNWFLFDDDCKMLTDKQKVGDKYYCLAKTGEMARGICTDYVTGTKYYGGTDGALEKGFKTVGGVLYYFNDDYSMATGDVNINGKTYHFASDGHLSIGWTYENGKWYYRNASGDLEKGWKYYRGAWYYLQDDYTMAIGLATCDGSEYCFNGSGAMTTGWEYDGRNWYYSGSDGKLVSGWLKDGGIWYYLTSEHNMVVGDYTVGSTLYHFNGSGAWIG